MNNIEGMRFSQPGGLLTDFVQYEHIATLQKLIDEDSTNTLAVAIGRDYLIKPDVTVGYRRSEESKPVLHASVSCKLTLRSDRAQNVRQESSIMIKYRRGRLPHIVAVTAEPLPTRIASLARGTGDIDGVYHVLYPALITAVADVGTVEQQGALEEMVGQRRLLPFDVLAEELAYESGSLESEETVCQ